MTDLVTDRPPCSCPTVYVGSHAAGRNLSETCPTHGIGTPWFNANRRDEYAAFRRRLFPALPADWTPEDDLRDLTENENENEE